MKIKNIIFDIGNVLVKCKIEKAIKHTFSEISSKPALEELKTKIFKSQIWHDFSAGKIDEPTALKLCTTQLHVDEKKIHNIFQYIRDHIEVIQGSMELLDELKALGLHLYCLSDLPKIFVEHFKNQHKFFHKFDGAAFAYEIGFLKPSHEIYQHIIKSYSLIPGETIYIDDKIVNVNGAKDVGIVGLHFTTPAECKLELQRLGILVK